MDLDVLYVLVWGNLMNSLQIRDLSPMAYAVTRIGARFFGAQVFTPGTAIAPAPADPPQLGPRQFQYPVSVNISRQPRRDFPNLTPFENLRQLCKQHPVAALCIRVRSEQVADIAGAVVAKRKKEQAALQRDCDAIEQRLFLAPDGTTPRSAWLKMLVRDLMEIDAPTIYKRPDRGGGLAAIEVVDGSTIKPVIGLSGHTVGYQQVLYGMALSQYLGRRAAAAEEVIVGEYSPGELWYQPYWPSTTSPYGTPPMEDMIRLAEIAINKQKFDLAHFTDGNIPAALGVFDGQVLNPDQVLSFEEDFNADLQANPARVGYMKFIPFPVKVERLKELTEGGRYESAAEEGNIKITCAFFGVTPTEIGFTADVNKATSEGQENVTYRRGIKPLLRWLKTSLFDPIIQVDCGRPDLEWQWDFGESEDRLKEAQIDAIYAPLGTVSGAELRTLRYPDLEGPPPPAPVAPQPGPAAKLLKAVDGPPDDADRLRAERVMARLLTDFFSGQIQRLQDWLADATRRTNSALQTFFDQEVKPLVRALMPFYDTTLTSAITAGGGQLAVDVAWDQVNAAVLALARQEAAALAAQLNATTQAQAAQILADWISTGGTLEELTDRLSLLYPPTRAEMIAVTETTRIYAKGNLAAWKAGGLVTAYTWQTSNDERVCPVCGPRQGKRYDIDSGEMPPAHPRCRCWIVPEVD